MPARKTPTLAPILAMSAALGMLAAGDAAADMIDTEGAAPWEVCGECHGLDGASPMPRFPKLAGQPAAYLEKQVRDFLSGARTNDGGQMQAVVTEITTEDIPRVAAYFAALPPAAHTADDGPAAGEAAWARILIERGREEVGLPACRSCHGTQPSPGSVAPRLEAQHRDYLAKQLRDFHSGERANDPAGVMAAIARRLGESEIEALSAYLATRPPLPNPG